MAAGWLRSPGIRCDPSLARSAIYEGTVVHRRPGPGAHRFARPVIMPLVDLAELDDLCRLHPLWSARHPAPVWWRRKDFLGDPAVPLDQAVRDLVEERRGHRPTGPIALLGNPRTWGWSFNPVSCYFCLAADGGAVTAMVMEVTNTPWNERVCYVMGGAGEHILTKALHVSPFLGMDASYRVRFSELGDQFALGIEVVRDQTTQLFAGMKLRRVPAERASLGRVLWSPRSGTVGVSAGIYREAIALGAKGTSFHRHPGRTDAAAGCAAARRRP